MMDKGSRLPLTMATTVMVTMVTTVSGYYGNKLVAMVTHLQTVFHFLSLINISLKTANSS